MNNARESSFVPKDDPIKEISYLQKHKGGTSVLAINENKLYSGGDDGVLNAFNLKTGMALHSIKSHKGSISALAFTSEGNVITGSSEDTFINLTDLSTNKSYKLTENKGPITKALYDKGVIVSSSLDGTIKVFQTAGMSKKSIATLQGTSPIKAMQWKNSLCVNGNDEGEVLLWDINEGRCFYKKRLHNGGVNNVLFHFDEYSGKHLNIILTTSGEEGTLNCIDMRSSLPIYTKTVHQGGINFIGTNIHNTIVTGGIDNQIKIIDISSGFKEMSVFKATDKVTCGDVTESFFCVGCGDGCLLGYNLKEMRSVFGYTCDEKGKVRQSIIVSNEKKIITGGDSGADLGLIFD